MLMEHARNVGCNYFTFNIPMTKCLDCNHVVNAPVTECPKCHSHKLDYYTRITGFLTSVSNWSKERQLEFKLRLFGNKKGSEFKHD